MKKGTTIIEILVSLAMFAVLAGSFYPIVGWLISRSKNLQYDSQAAMVLQSGHEAAYNAFLAKNILPPGGTYKVALNLAGYFELLPLNSGQVDEVEGRFGREIFVQQGCRDNITGKLASKKVTCSILTPDLANICPSGYQLDTFSRIITTRVSWVESSGKKQLCSDLLITNL